MTEIAILGLGEAGRQYAQGLARAGARVRGFDPFQDVRDIGIDQRDELSEAVADAEVVLSLVGAVPAVEVAENAIPYLRGGAIYADLNTAAPQMKQQIARLAETHGRRMADVAVLAPVLRAGHQTALLASGPAAESLVGILSPLGVPITAMSGAAGEAARLKLLRSVFMKGLATLVIESLGAARASGSELWLRDLIADELGEGGDDLVDRLVAGTYEHAPRREHEVRDALAELEASGQPSDMTRATLAWFERFLAARD